MIDIDKISIEKTTASRIGELENTDLLFGKTFSDHMLVADFRSGEWNNARIVPYNYLPISPATPAIHYGLSIFEGLKAYKSEDNKVLIFRPMDHYKRMNRSAERLCMPPLPEYLFTEGLKALLDLDQDWIPTSPEGSLYIPPFMFSGDEFIGVRPSSNFVFVIITCPVEALYSSPIKVCIESHYTRAVAGGVGYAKTGGNYGGSLYATKLAHEKGYDQLIWTDGKEHKYIEESGTMNLMFMLDNTLVTPSLSDSILDGITRDSVLTLARHWNIKVEERKILVKELIDGLKSNRVTEAFGTGTAATIAHIKAIGYEGQDYLLPPVGQQSFSNRVVKALNSLRRGNSPDVFGWVHNL